MDAAEVRLHLRRLASAVERLQEACRHLADMAGILAEQARDAEVTRACDDVRERVEALTEEER